jgi:hypothetical protein
MKLVKIHEELINEAARGPLGAFEFIFKAAGKGLAEANGALLKSVQKINPNVKQLFRATPEEVNKAFKRTEFKEYRKIIVDHTLTNQKKEIEKILKKFDLSNTESVKLAKAEVANKLSLKDAVAYDVVERYRPKTQKTVKTNLSVETSIDDLWNYFSRDQMRYYKIKKLLTPEQGKLFIKQIKPEIEKTVQKEFPKIEKKLLDLKSKYDILTPVQQKKLLVDTQKAIYDLGTKKGMSTETISLLWSSIFGFVKGTTPKTKLYASFIMAGLSFGIDTAVFVHEKEFKGHFNLPLHSTVILKLLAAAGGFILGGWPGIILSLIILIDSMKGGIEDIFKHVGEKNKVKSSVLGDDPPSEDDVDFNDNK